MAVDRIKHTKPASQRTFLDELEPIPYEISEEELAAMDPRMKKILFGIDDAADYEDDWDEPDDAEVEVSAADLLDEGEDAQAEAAVRDEPEQLRIEEPAAPEEPPDEEPAPPPEEPEEERFDPRAVAEFPPREDHHIALVFQEREGYEDAVVAARDAAEHVEKEIEGTTWHAARFGRAEAEALKQLNDLLGDRDDVHVLVDGVRAPFGRSLWLPMMYIFASNKEETP